jgi:class 3 adenylate cyclase/tetratricopeptide (TPR) repeat protein
MTMRCAACGHENEIGSRFCDECGATMAIACPACGEANRPDGRFCKSCGAAMGSDAPKAQQAATAERRLVTVLFTDLVGFTTFAEDRDPEHVRELLSRYFATATDLIQRHGGTVEKFIGDAVMAVWGTPVAHEDDAERAVRAALELVDAVRVLSPALQARAGVLTGEAAVTLGAQNQGMVAGDLVNTAARLQGVAEPGTVLVGEATMRAASGAIVFEPIGDHSLKGKTAPIPAWQALRDVAARGGQGRADALEPPFVGREEELRQLKEQLHAVGREHRVRLVSITGPAGIGKSRLVWELEKYVDGVTESIWWHRGRSPSYGEGITFWALGEMIRRRAGLAEDDDEATTREKIAATLAQHVPEAADRERIEPALLTLLGVEPAPAGGRDTLFPAWRLFFEKIAASGTTVLVFEDLQWADSGLLDFIDHLLDWLKALPIMVVTLSRPELFDRRPDWAAGRRHLTALALEPLSDASITELLAGLVPGLPDAAMRAIVARAEGMPLYAVETVRSLMADGHIERKGDVYQPVGDLSKLAVPESLRSLIASRLDALDASDRSLLQDAAVLGQVFSADALAAISGATTDGLEPKLRALVRRELLELESDPQSPERGQYRFVQSLIREVAYGTLARRDRRVRHLAVARHYEGQGDEELAGALASHYLAAPQTSDEGPEADAVAVQARLALSAAADRAASLGAPDEAVTFLEQALSVTTAPGDRAELLDRAAQAAAAGARTDAARYATAAIDAFRELHDPIGVARATGRLGQILLDTREVGKAVEVLEAAISAAEKIDAPSVLAETLAYMARAYMRGADQDKAIAAADRSLIIAERLNLEEVVTEALLNKGSAMENSGRPREGLALLATAVERSQRYGWTSRELRARHNLAVGLWDDEPKRARLVEQEALALARQLGDTGSVIGLSVNTALSLYDEGRQWDEHSLFLREALGVATLPSDRAQLRGALGLFETARGEALDTLVAEMSQGIGDDADPEELEAVALAEADVALVSGDLHSAYRQGMRAADIPTQSPLLGYFAAGRAAIWARNLEWIRNVATGMAVVTYTGPRTTAVKEQLNAAVAALEGRRADALAGLRESRNLLRGLEQWFSAARHSLEAIILLPDDPEVRAWAEDARALFTELRAQPYLDRLDAALASAPSTAPAVAPSEAARTRA